MVVIEDNKEKEKRSKKEEAMGKEEDIIIKKYMNDEYNMKQYACE